jgi:sterol desaturase/sphingolipid hydroxylase (fatty acid hydroxylase superfamily)
MELLGFDYFFDPNKRLYFLYLLSSFLLAGVYLYFNQNQKRIVLSSKLWLHPSAKLDYLYFFVNIAIKIMLIFPLMISAKEITLFTYTQLIDAFGTNFIYLDYMWVLVLYTLTLFLASDFTRYWVHRFLHTIPILWEFHKVHHSAKVLTPFTFYRVHPVENILFGLRYALSIGFVTGVFFYFFGAKLDLYTILGVNIVVFLFNLLGSNLRHTHIKFKYFTWLESWLISPYMHQIHHSKKYFNKNYGGYLAIWDRLFHTHIPSKEVVKLRFGLQKEQMKAYSNLFLILFTPFINIAKRIQRAKH